MHHPRPPSLSPRAFGAWHIMPLFYQKICLPNLPPKKWTPWSEVDWYLSELGRTFFLYKFMEFLKKFRPQNAR